MLREQLLKLEQTITELHGVNVQLRLEVQRLLDGTLKMAAAPGDGK